MAYDLEEQEQIARIKAFWERYGNFILTVLTVVLLSIAGYRGWGWYQAKQANEAATVYAELRVAVARNDVAKVKETAGTIFASYGGTAYAPMAALLAAKVHHEAGDLKSAKPPLQWAIENASDEVFVNLAKLRLAGILADEKAYDEALKLLPDLGSGPYAGEFADRRGDVLVAQDKHDAARAAYRSALERLGARSPLRGLVQLKLDALGTSGS